MTIQGTQGLTDKDIARELEHGAKFVVFQYCFSIIIMTFRRSSEIYFIKAGETGLSKSISFSIISLIIGWWGIPWGPIYTISSLVTNFKGGKNVTNEVLRSLQPVQSTPNL